MGEDLITNRKAHRDYEILETYEAGIVLRGTEVKSLRAGQGNLTDAFARIEKNEAWLYNFDIQPYKQATIFNHETVILDGETFSSCEFRDCRLVYSGGEPPSFQGCRIDDCEWKFEGPAAAHYEWFSIRARSRFRGCGPGRVRQCFLSGEAGNVACGRNIGAVPLPDYRLGWTASTGR